MSLLLIAAGISLAPCDAPCVHRIVFTNQIEHARAAEEVHTIETSIGTIHLFHTRRPKYGPEPHDTLEVVDLPGDYVPIPAAIDVDETETGVIEIHSFSGL